MKNVKLLQYSGPLNAKQAAEGIKIACENARALFAEAELLFKHAHYERALVLAVLAIEESGKESIIRQILISTDSESLKAAWREYRSHTKKNLMWVFEMYLHQGARKLEDFRGIFDEENDYGFQLEKAKQLALYSDAYNDCQWSRPKDKIDKDLAESILNIARKRVTPKTKFSNAEGFLEIWQRHAKSARAATLTDQKNVLLAVYREAEQKGFLPKGSFEEMKKFVEIGIASDSE